MKASNAATSLRDIRRALELELEAKGRKRVAVAERDAERARQRERKMVDALEEARGYTRALADEVVALMQRNKQWETKLATAATAEETCLQMHCDTYKVVQVATEERRHKLLDVLAARRSAVTSQSSPTGSRTARSALESSNLPYGLLVSMQFIAR